MSEYLYDEEDMQKLTPKQKELIREIEKLSKKVLGDDFEDFADYMKQPAVTINMSRMRTNIEFKNVSETELMDILLPNLIKRILNFYKPEDRIDVITNVLKECKDGKEELCIEEN